MRRLFSHWAQTSPITARSIAILVTASVIGAAAGILTYLAYYSVPQALLAASAATGGSTRLLHQLIGTNPERVNSAQNKGHDDRAGQRTPSPQTQTPNDQTRLR